MPQVKFRNSYGLIQTLTMGVLGEERYIAMQSDANNLLVFSAIRFADKHLKGKYVSVSSLETLSCLPTEDKFTGTYTSYQIEEFFEDSLFQTWFENQDALPIDDISWWEKVYTGSTRWWHGKVSA